MTHRSRLFLILAAVAVTGYASGKVSDLTRADAAEQGAGSRPPNFVVIFTDDQGYGDLGSYGHPTLRTPNLDRLAVEGQRWTSFYAAPVCTPSRAQLLTGRLAVRTGLAGGVLHPDSPGGLQPSEITIPEVLKPRGYAAIAIGKWHLGVASQYLPTNQGFDSYFGIPYSNDMDMIPEGLPKSSEGLQAARFDGYMNAKVEYFRVPLMRNQEIIERPADQTTITKRYTDEAISFIRANRERPFFVYLAHNMPHMPLFTSKEFEGKSVRGKYGDVVEEIDANVGRLVETLRELQLDRNTLVVFLSDNGPWAPYQEQGGSAGLLRGAKGSNWEGGVRVPAIFWWPGTIKPAVVTGIGSQLDLLQTFASLAGAEAPRDRPLDGFDLSATLTRGAPSARDRVFYYGENLAAVRKGAFKWHLPTQGPGRGGAPAAQSSGQLYNLDEDPAEQFDLASRRADVIADMKAIADEHTKSVVRGASQLEYGPQMRKLIESLRGGGAGTGAGAGGTGRGQ